MKEFYPDNKLTIVGGGIIGALEAYYAYQDAKKNGKQVRITIHEKNSQIGDTTTGGIVPSLTIDEIIAVMPSAQILIEKMKLLFNQPGGIRVDEPGVNNSAVAKEFIEQVKRYSEDVEASDARTKVLLELGKMSMDLWQNLYAEGDETFKAILRDSNFNPCREPQKAERQLHDGYRIDLLYHLADAKNKASAMKDTYQNFGYKHCKILTPQEVMAVDPFLTDFCNSHSVLGESGERQWKEDAVALWRPGGCIDTQVFLPKLYQYLKAAMGQYANEVGESKDCFQLKLNHHVTGVKYAPTNKKRIDGLQFFSKSSKENKHQYQDSQYVFCPGESVGTLRSLGFEEPAYASFAGASLMLNIPITDALIKKYKNFNHCMEVHQEGVVLAWQARLTDNKIFIGVAGTKAFYGDQKPHKDQAFAKDRNLLQLNIINQVLPEFISLALNKDTKGIQLIEADLTCLEEKGIAKRWVGRRGLSANAFPTIGPVFRKEETTQESVLIDNGVCKTHAGSGGCSFGPVIAKLNPNAFYQTGKIADLIAKVFEYGDPRRKLTS